MACRARYSIASLLLTLSILRVSKKTIFIWLVFKKQVRLGLAH